MPFLDIHDGYQTYIRTAQANVQDIHKTVHVDDVRRVSRVGNKNRLIKIYIMFNDTVSKT